LDEEMVAKYGVPEMSRGASTFGSQVGTQKALQIRKRALNIRKRELGAL